MDEVREEHDGNPILEATDSVREAAGDLSKAAKKNIKPIIIAVAAVAVLAIVFMAIFNTNPKKKIASAIVKTIQDDTFAKPINTAYKILNSNLYTLSAKGNVGSDMYGDYGMDPISADFELYITANTKDSVVGGETKVNVEGIAEQTLGYYFDKEIVQLQFPDLSKKVYEYNYKKDNKGEFIVRNHNFLKVFKKTMRILLGLEYSFIRMTMLGIISAVTLI